VVIVSRAGHVIFNLIVCVLLGFHVVVKDNYWVVLRAGNNVLIFAKRLD